MQPGSTFQKLEAVGSCQVGTVWSAVDAHGLAVTVAMLDETVATDKRWRDAFVSTAQSMAGGSGGPRFLYADFSAAAPWVACDGPGAEQIFIALGMDYKPAASPDSTDQASGAGADPASPASAAPASADGADPVSPASPAGGADSSGQADTPAATADQPVTESPTVAIPRVAHPPVPASAPPVSAAPSSGSATTAAVPDAPQSPVPGPRPPTFSPPPPVSDAGPGGGWSPELAGSVSEMSYTYQPRFSSIDSSDLGARRRRGGLWIGVAVVVVLVLAAAGGIYAWQAGGGTPVAAKSSTPAPTNTVSLSPALPTASPLQPGVEPPKPGTWPKQWPRFKDTDRVRTFNLDGVGLPIKTPLSWQCVTEGQAEGSVRYNCGTSGDNGAAIGGELIVRACPAPCGEKEQTAMRRAEEAWGLQWLQIGQNSYFAESSSLQLDGGQRYGLVVVAFWRSGVDGAVDRELVFRGTSPVDGAGQLRRVANYIRDVALF